MAGENRIREFIRQLEAQDPTEQLDEVDFHLMTGELGPFPMLGGSLLFQELLEALRKNHSVRKASVMLRFLLGMTEDEKLEFHRAIGSIPSLESLHMKGSGLAGFGLEVTTEAIRNTRQLKHLTLCAVHFSAHYRTRGATNTNDPDYVEFCHVVQQLRHLKSFRLLDVEDSFDLNPLVSVLLTLPNLEEISIKALAYTFPSWPRLSRVSLESLAKSTMLKQLALQRLQLGPFLSRLLYFLQYNRTLEKLCLEDYHMCQECGMAIARLLHSNHRLKILQISFKTVPSLSTVAIASAAAKHSELESLEYSVSGLVDEDMAAFADLLAAPKSLSPRHLSRLSLANNHVSEEGVHLLANALRCNSQLESLDLSETQLTNAGASCLAASLASIVSPSNQSLKSLMLSHNKIEDDGCIALAQMLHHNTSLQELDLSGNPIGDAGGIALASTLGVNRNLLSLRLVDIPNLDPPTYEAWETTLRFNTTLLELELPNLPMGSCLPSYVRLNRLGRHRLLHHLSNATDWVDTLTHCTDDLHCVQFMIRANPALCRSGPKARVLGSSLDSMQT